MKEILGYPDYYVTEAGEVWSRKRNKITKLNPYLDTHGYPVVGLCANSACKLHKVHRLVASAFIPNTNNLPCVLHKDDNPGNPHKDNLFWGTHRDNMSDMVSKGRSCKGEEQRDARLTEDQVRYIRSFQYRRGLFQELARSLNCHCDTIKKAYNKLTWAHVL